MRRVYLDKGLNTFIKRFIQRQMTGWKTHQTTAAVRIVIQGENERGKGSCYGTGCSDTPWGRLTARAATKTTSERSR